MGSLPYGSLPHDDTKGAMPPLDPPAGPPNILSDEGYARGFHKNHVSTSTNR